MTFKPIILIPLVFVAFTATAYSFPVGLNQPSHGTRLKFDLSSFFPHLSSASHITVHRSPVNDFNQFVSDFFRKTVPSYFKPLKNFFSIPMHYFRKDKPIRISKIRVIRKPNYVAHECFLDSINYCHGPLNNNDEFETRYCMMDNILKFSPSCQKVLRSGPSVIEACYNDIVKYCDMYNASPLKAMHCLKEHVSDIQEEKCLEKLHVKTVKHTQTLSSQTHENQKIAPVHQYHGIVIGIALGCGLILVAAILTSYLSRKKRTSQEGHGVYEPVSGDDSIYKEYA